jgi:hypothetical protein
MTIEKVFSKIQDNNIQNNITTSKIWEECYKEDELESKAGYYCYTIKFDGLKPIQCTKIQKFKE